MNIRLSQNQKIKVLNSEDIYKVMQQILLRENKICRNQEHFWVIGMNHRNKILFIELISLGATNAILVKPREVFRMAIYKMAVKMILVHNHPSGEVEPSAADQDFTDRLLKSGDILGIEVIDHLVISEKRYFSFDDEALLVKLKESKNYTLVDREKNELTEWKLQMERERAVNEFAKEIAKKMRSMNYTADTIKQLTGLTTEEVKKL